MKDRIAIVTGASSGIGRATAFRLARRGIKVLLNARDRARLLNVANEIAEKHPESTLHVVEGDMSGAGGADGCIAACKKIWGAAPDIFVASAGRGLPGTVITSDPDKWDEMIDTNVKGLMYQLRSIGKSMLAQHGAGKDFVADPSDIVVIGSSIGRNVSPFNSVYGATKFATHGVTEALRRELGPHGIRVTLIEPGLVGTNFQETAGYDKSWFEKYKVEVGPILTGDDVAAVIEYILHVPGNVHLDNISIRPTRQSYP